MFPATFGHRSITTGRRLVFGIAGFLDPDGGRGPDWMRRRVIAMTNAIAHHGPGEESTWIDPIVQAPGTHAHS
jgi:asparagine synthetase B (glutamine-hydrolysing)